MRILAILLISCCTWVAAAHAADPIIGHMVYFKLKDTSAESKKAFVAACDKYLKGHEGTIFYAAGVIGESFKRSVNDRDWDIALHLVFKDKAAHDKYHVHPRHDDFVAFIKEKVEKVRVFDSEIESEAAKK